MDTFFFILAVGIFLITVHDVIVTVLSHNGAGLVTRTWTSWVWRLVLKSKYSFKSKLLIRYIGPPMLIGIFIVWYVLLYLVWFLFLKFGDYTLMNDKDSAVGTLDILYYIGSTFATLGIGDYTPRTFPWTLITTFGALTVSLLTSLSISFFVPVIGAVAERRKLITNLNNLGRSASDVLKFSWTGESSGRMDPVIINITEGVVNESYKSQVYPVIGYFYFKETSCSINLNILSLYDALIFQQVHDQRADNAIWQVRSYLRDSIEVYIKNSSMNGTIKKESFHYSHQDFIDFINSYEHKANDTYSKDLSKELTNREYLLVFAHHEGRLKDENGLLKQKYI